MEPLPIVLVLIASVLGLLKGRFPRIATPAFYGLIVIALVIGVVDFHQQRERDRAELCHQYSGIIKSQTKSSAEYPVLSTGGDIPAELGWRWGPDKPMMRLGSEPVFLRLDEGRARISFSFRDSSGAVIGYVRNNEWKVSASAILEHNFNEDSLEIIGQHNEILVQLRVVGERVLLAGTFYSSEGGSTPPFIYGPWLGRGEGDEARLFRYPSCMHPGELRD